MSNQVFADNSWYFRNALVRANYNDLQNDVHATTVFLEQFMENLLTGAQHNLKNRYMHIDYADAAQSAIQSAKSDVSKCQNCTLEELALLRAIAQNPAITQKELAATVGTSERTIKRRTVELQEKGLLRRKNGKRNGQWEVLVEIEGKAVTAVWEIDSGCCCGFDSRVRFFVYLNLKNCLNYGIIERKPRGGMNRVAGRKSKTNHR